MTQPLTAQQLDAIETRAAHLAEYAHQDDGEGDTLAGTDVPALLAEVRRLTDRINAVTGLLDQQELAARGFEVPLPEWVSAVRRAVQYDTPARP
jgi:hypothetical protein